MRDRRATVKAKARVFTSEYVVIEDLYTYVTNSLIRFRRIRCKEGGAIAEEMQGHKRGGSSPFLIGVDLKNRTTVFKLSTPAIF